MCRDSIVLNNTIVLSLLAHFRSLLSPVFPHSCSLALNPVDFVHQDLLLEQMRSQVESAVGRIDEA